jgi:chorismate mutase
MKAKEKQKLKNIRKEIDKIDGEIIKLISKRINIGIKVGIIKSQLFNKQGKNKLNKLRDKKREAEVLKNIEKRCKKLGIDHETLKRIKALYKILMKKNLEKQVNILNSFFSKPKNGNLHRR